MTSLFSDLPSFVQLFSVLKNLYSLCKNEVPFGVSVNQQIFIKTNQ